MLIASPASDGGFGKISPKCVYNILSYSCQVRNEQTNTTQLITSFNGGGKDNIVYFTSPCKRTFELDVFS